MFWVFPLGFWSLCVLLHIMILNQWRGRLQMDPDPIIYEQRSLYSCANIVAIIKKTWLIGWTEGDSFHHPNRILCRNTFLFSNNRGWLMTTESDERIMRCPQVQRVQLQVRTWTLGSTFHCETFSTGRFTDLSAGETQRYCQRCTDVEPHLSSITH